MTSQISSLTNVTKIVNAISSLKKEKISHEMVSNYIEHITDSFLVSKAKRYDIKGKSYFEYPNKYYYEDIGLRNARLNFRQIDQGHLMENVLFNELIRRGYSVDVGAVSIRKGNSLEFVEIDFIVNKLDTKVYVQSVFQMTSEEKIELEIRPFTLTEDFFKKVIVRNDILSSYYDDKGVFHCRLIDFLLGRVDFLD